MIQCLISSTDKAAPFNERMPIIKRRGGEILIIGMNLKPLKGINAGKRMLPDIAHNIKEAFLPKHVYRIRRQPILQINISDLLILPLIKVLFEKIPHRIILVFCWQSQVLACLMAFPCTEGLRLQIVDLCWPVPGHLNQAGYCSEVELWLLGVLVQDLPEDWFGCFC